MSDSRAIHKVSQISRFLKRPIRTVNVYRSDHQIAKRRAEYTAAQQNLARAQTLAEKRVITTEQLERTQTECQVSFAQYEQARAEKRLDEAQGTREAEMELARREQELAAARSALTLLAAGTRPEEIEAEEARMNRLAEEVAYLEQLGEKLLVFSQAHGIVTTAHLKEKLGQYVEEGELICLIEEPTVLEADIELAEQDVGRVRDGQLVQLKARALPFETFETKVSRIAPAAEPDELQSTVNVVCRLDADEQSLKPGMTGYARIYTGRCSLGEFTVHRILRFVRTEFWW